VEYCFFRFLLFFSFGVVNEEPDDIKQPCEPGNNENNMERFDVEIHGVNVLRNTNTPRQNFPEENFATPLIEGNAFARPVGYKLKNSADNKKPLLTQGFLCS
jgi:hypothetical protein